eukprot:SAG31_NODE_7702_length_1613_cov_1.116248_3_plen_60_part_01
MYFVSRFIQHKYRYRVTISTVYVRAATRLSHVPIRTRSVAYERACRRRSSVSTLAHASHC